MKHFIAIWLIVTFSVGIGVGAFAGLFALGLRSPYIGIITASVFMVSVKTVVHFVYKAMK